jgi:RNA polymerase sigma-70 factor, ECF subfamily
VAHLTLDSCACLGTAPDERLLALARCGDERAFAVIVERHRPALVRHAQPILGDGAQDAAQQALTSAWLALRDGCEVHALRPWLCSIARNAALEMLRQRGERTQRISPALAGGHAPPELAEQRARARRALAVIDKLPLAQREAFVGTSLHGRSGRAVAHSMGVSEAAVRQLVYQARARVRRSVPIFLPPLALARVPARLLSRARRAGALLVHQPGVPGADGMAPFGRLATALVSVTIVATPLTVAQLAAPPARHDRRSALSPLPPGRAQQATIAQIRAGALRRPDGAERAGKDGLLRRGAGAGASIVVPASPTPGTTTVAGDISGAEATGSGASSGPALVPRTRPLPSGSAQHPAAAGSGEGEPVRTILGTAGEPVAEVAKPVAEVVKPVVEIVRPMAEVVKPVSEAVKPVLEAVKPLTRAVGPVLGEVAKPLAAVTKPVAADVKPAGEVLQPVIARVTR